MEMQSETHILKQQPSARPTRPVQVAAPQAVFEQKPNGIVHVRSTEVLRAYPDRLTDCLKRWAQKTPDHVFLAQRGPNGTWQKLTYSETWRRARRIAAALLKRRLSPERPLAILSGNSIEHALMALAAMYVGVPYAPVAPAYSLSVREY